MMKKKKKSTKKNQLFNNDADNSRSNERYIYLSLVSRVDSFYSSFHPCAPFKRWYRKFQKSLTIVKDVFGNK